MLTKPLPGVMDDPFHPLSQGCVCHLLFNEGAGNLAYDVSGNGNHGTLKNMLPNTQGSKWQGSKFGGALDFDGQDDYINCGNDPSLNITDAITIEAWVKADVVSGYQSIWGGFNLSAQTKNYLLLDDNKVSFDQYPPSGGQLKSASTISAGLWYHIVVTVNGSNRAIYINGNEDISDSSAESYSGGAVQKWGIGYRYRSASQWFFNGSIGGVKIYNRALSAEEGKQLYHDPFCNLIQVPAWQLYSPAVGGLSIPVAMHHYEALRV